ncbi:MAG TPA: glycine cleavage system aminomethyltransferase GcvT [Candidatus Hydrogenedentes bacterium]|nr:glycine cleavage system aminomethyltransferase GcvT [Candidatus Hydrogenedentota bacterium]
MRQTMLLDQHKACGAKLVDFHGWLLPLQYKGILQEHNHTRTKCSVFDCSHMGQFLIKTRKAIATFDQLVFSDMVGLPPGRGRYSSILNEYAGIIDDIVAFRLSRDELFVVTNAGPLDRVAQTIQSYVPKAVDLSEQTSKIDVQGPESFEVLSRMGFEELAPLRFFGCLQTTWRGRKIIVARAGYTGELGYEFYVPHALAAALWEALLEQKSVKPAGLGARDTLRLEMGYTLYGQDVDESTTTLEAAMGRFIYWGRGFIGRDALCVRQQMHDYKVRAGIRAEGRRAPRAKQEVYRDDEPVGVVTSGTYGPSVGCGIGMAYVPKDLAEPGVQLAVGPKRVRVETAAFPFYKRGTFRMNTSQ